MRRHPKAFAPVKGLISVGLVVALAGCTAAATTKQPATKASTSVATRLPATTPTPTPTPTPIPTPTLTAGSPGLVVVPAASNDIDPSHPPYDVIVDPSEVLVGHYTNYRFPVQIPHDDGPGEYARGTPVTQGGTIVAYKVAPGDIYDYIAKRFHLTNNGYLLILNEPRRGEAPALYAGDVLNLSARTLNKYGTVNGRIARGPQPVIAPKQDA